MSKSPRRRNPIEQYDRFMIGGKTHTTFRGVLLLAGGFVGNTILWLTGLITVARISIVFIFVLVTAVIWGITQRLLPNLELPTVILMSAIIALVLVTIGVVVVKARLRRDEQNIGQNPTFGVFDEDARARDKQNHRRKSGR